MYLPVTKINSKWDSGNLIFCNSSSGEEILEIDNSTDSINVNLLKVGDVDGGNYSEFETDGSLILNGNATTWEDLFVPLTTSKVGSNAKPDYDYTNNGFLFPQNDATEILYFVVQLPHKRKVGSTIYPHIHWQQSANQNVTFKIDYKWFNIGEAVPANYTTLAIGTLAQTYTSGNLHQISKSASGIDGTGKGISSLMLIKLYRDDNVYTGDALTFQFDIHYEIDSLGSRQEYTK